ISSVGGAGETWTGSPLPTGEVVDPVKRTVNLLYAVDNTTGRLKLGMSVTVAVPAGSGAPAVMVPEAALIESAGGKGVVYVRRGPATFAEEEVGVGVRQDSLVAVNGEVKAGDDIVVTGASELFGKLPGRLVTEE